MTEAELATSHVPEDPHLPCQRGYVVLCCILRARVQCAITLISPLFATVLWPGTAPPDSLGDPRHNDLCDPMRGLHGDRAPLPYVELLLLRWLLLGSGA
jgi:hypothetical protein